MLTCVEVCGESLVKQLIIYYVENRVLTVLQLHVLLETKHNMTEKHKYCVWQDAPFLRYGMGQ